MEMYMINDYLNMLKPDFVSAMVTVAGGFMSLYFVNILLYAISNYKLVGKT